MAKKSASSAASGKAKALPRARKAAKDGAHPVDKPPGKAEASSNIAVKQLKAFRKQLRTLGYTSVFDVVRQGRIQVVANCLGKKTAKRAERAAAEHFYEQAEAQAAALTRLHRQLTARGEPIIQGIAKLGIAYDEEWLGRAIGSSGNYHDWFGQNALYAHPDSVGSLFSPGSYLTTLYRTAKPLHPASHGLQLDNRRPDLAALTLSDSHLNQELSTLALTLEILEQGIGGDVDEKLRTAIYPMNLPYNHAWDQIRQGLAVKKISQAKVWAVMGDHEARAFAPAAPDAWWREVLSPAYVRDRLALSPEEYQILTQPRVGAETPGWYYGLNRMSDLKHVGSEASVPPTEATLHGQTKLDHETLLQALGTGFVNSLGSLRLSPAPEDFQLQAGPGGAAVTEFKLQGFEYTISDNGHVILRFKVQVQREEMPYSQPGVAVSEDPLDWSDFKTLKWADAPDWATSDVEFDLGTLGNIMRDGLRLHVIVLASEQNPPPNQTASRPFLLNIERVHETGFVSPAEYGARYINGWQVARNSPLSLYAYIGPQVGHPATPPVNDPPTSRLYHRQNNTFERLNRLIRLQRRVGLTFEELDWSIVAAAAKLVDYPLTRPLQALAVYLPLRERYGMSVNAFVACIGTINTFHRPNERSLFAQMFGENDFLGERLYLSPPRDSVGSTAARTRLCQGLGISADVFMTLARLLPGVVSETGEGYVLPILCSYHVDALYRLVTIPRLFGLEPLEALGLWDLLGEPGLVARSLTAERPVTTALGVLERTAYLVDWMRREQLDTPSLIALTSRNYRQVATPELQSFIQNIFTTLGGASSDKRDDQVLRDLLCRHIGAQFGLKPATSLRLIEWMDVVAERMNPAFAGYSVLTFWAQIQAVCGNATLGAAMLEEQVPQLVQYANLLGQFALLCHWAQLTEQDLELVMPGAPAPSPLTGRLQPPLPDLSFLLLLSRYRQWHKLLVRPIAEGRRYLQRAAAGEAVGAAEVAQELALLHGWDVIQVQGYLDSLSGFTPRSFADLYPIIARMQLAQRLGQAPTDLARLAVLAEATPTQSMLKQVAAAILAAAHA